MAALLQIDGLRKRFGGVAATDGVDLAVEEGELHAIIGPNGAGKTTLIAQLCGTVRPDAGSIRFAGTDITARPAHARARMGMTRSFQITCLIMTMSVLDNVALAVQARSGHSFRFLRPARAERAIRDEAMAYLERFGLAGRADEPAVALSHGEHRLMEITIALAAQARLILLDEPTAGLGPEETARMIDFLKTLKGDHTIVLVEHDMDAVFALADRISVLVYGRIIATGAPDAVRHNDDVRHAYLGEE